jgi:hypothetical protein
MWSVRDTYSLEALLSWASSRMPDAWFPALQHHYFEGIATSLGNTYAIAIQSLKTRQASFLEVFES